MSMDMNESYSEVRGVSSEGSGNMNGRRDENVRWVVSFSPGTPRLTMSTSFEVLI
jgi:hypothetical protein